MRRVAIVAAALAIVAAASIELVPARAPAHAAEGSRPNILFIITDDQRLESGMAVMPNTLKLFRDAGTEFTNFSVTTPLCCPARGSFASGRYAHNHGVLTNGDLAAEQAFDQTTAIQYYLRNAGYMTAIVGKYWNQWPLQDQPPNYLRWATFGGQYNDAKFNVNGTIATYSGYTTDVLGSFSTQFLQSFEANDAQPWFLYVAPHAPHSDFTASTTYANAPVPAWSGNPAVFETDRSDKPPAVRNRSLTYTDGDARRTAQLRTLMSVDDMVQRIFDKLDALGETQNTLAIFTSDNGMMWAEHGVVDKRFPYLQSTQVPMFLRWPGHVAAGAVDDRLTANIDVEPTLLQAAGITPAHVVDGASLFSTGSRTRLLQEYFLSPDSGVPSWASDVTPTYQYTEWYSPTTGGITFREYYDLLHDPWQLVNLLADGNATNDPNVTALHNQLAADRTCAGSTCPQPVSSTPDTQAPTVPGTPSGTSTAAGQIALTWAASTDDRATTLAYRVYRDDGATPVGSVSSASTTTVSFTDTGLAPGSVHTYRVDAFDGTNASAESAASDPITVASAPATIFSDSFGSGLSAWTSVTNLTLDPTRFPPTGAAPSVRAAVSGVNAFARHTLPSTYPSLCMREAVNLQSIGTQAVALLKLRTAGNVSVGRVFASPTRILNVRADVSGTTLYSGKTLPSGWNTIEACATTGTAGSWQLFLNGTRIGDWTANNGTAPIGRVQIGDDAAKTVTVNVDDVVVT
jgi:arylsulfatase A-like enzyme